MLDFEAGNLPKRGIVPRFHRLFEHLAEMLSSYFHPIRESRNYDFRMNDTDDDGKEVASVSFVVKMVTEGSKLSLDKDTYAPEEEIRLSFTAPAEFGPKAWVGIIPADVPHGSEDENDQHDISYRYLDKKTQGLLVFNAPKKPGKYDFRMHDTDDNGNEITYIEFTVK